jgi:hypothetical protein
MVVILVMSGWGVLLVSLGYGMMWAGLCAADGDDTKRFWMMVVWWW